MSKEVQPGRDRPASVVLLPRGMGRAFPDSSLVRMGHSRRDSPLPVREALEQALSFLFSLQAGEEHFPHLSWGPSTLCI